MDRDLLARANAIPTVEVLRSVALYHHSCGRSVVAVLANKSTTIKWGRWEHQPQTIEEVSTMFGTGAYGLALLTWPVSNLVVLDFDGIHARAAWATTGIKLPETATNETRKGFHLIYKVSNRLTSDPPRRRVRFVSAGRECQCKNRCGVDLLLRGYFVVPPTPGYLEDSEHPFDVFAVIPDAVVELAKSRTKEHRQFERQRDAGRIPTGERNHALTSLAGSMRHRGMTYSEILAALRVVSKERCDPPLSENEVETIARSIAFRYEPRS